MAVARGGGGGGNNEKNRFVGEIVLDKITKVTNFKKSNIN